MIIRQFAALAVTLVCVGSAADASDIRRVVTGLDADNKAVVMFDSRLTLKAGPYGLQSTNLWVTNTYPLGFSFKDDTAATPVGISPLDNGTKFRVVEFPPLDAASEAKMEPGFLMKAVGPVAPAKGRPVTHPLMHRTRSVDYAVVLSGEIDMMLDENAGRNRRPSEAGRHDRAAGHQSRLGQSRNGALPYPVCFDGFQAALSRSRATFSADYKLDIKEICGFFRSRNV